MVDYDLAIIGSGGAAFGAAIEARRRDARVVMIEQRIVGGTCVNVGCIPSKTLLAAARTFHTAGSHPFDGLPTSTGPIDLTALVAQKDELIAGMRQHKYSISQPSTGSRSSTVTHSSKTPQASPSTATISTPTPTWSPPEPNRPSRPCPAYRRPAT
jgi:hypothetical protein